MSVIILKMRRAPSNWPSWRPASLILSDWELRIVCSFSGRHHSHECSAGVYDRLCTLYLCWWPLLAAVQSHLESRPVSVLCCWHTHSIVSLAVRSSDGAFGYRFLPLFLIFIAWLNLSEQRDCQCRQLPPSRPSTAALPTNQTDDDDDCVTVRQWLDLWARLLDALWQTRFGHPSPVPPEYVSNSGWLLFGSNSIFISLSVHLPLPVLWQLLQRVVSNEICQT